MDPVTDKLIEYGVLGLWTASLLYANWKAKKEFQDRYDRLNEQVLGLIKENNVHLESGLREMRERYREERQFQADLSEKISTMGFKNQSQ